MYIVSPIVRVVQRMLAHDSRRMRRDPNRGFHRPILEELEPRWVPSTNDGASAITDHFNAAPVAAGDTLWFSSVFNVDGLSSKQKTPVTFHFTQGTISFTAAGVSYKVSTPDADVTLSPTAKVATTTFNASLNAWETTVPMKDAGAAFLDGAELHLTSALPGNIKNVTWSGVFSTDTQGVSLDWRWAAASYKTFSTNYNALDVKPVSGKEFTTDKNSDRAGTPEAFLSYVVAGGTGHGHKNYTGSHSATVDVKPTMAATVSGEVTNSSGVGLSGVRVALTTTNSTGQLVTVFATTNSSGFYEFTGVKAGTYTLSVTAPAGYQNGPDAVGTVNGAASGHATSNGTIANIGLTAGGIGRNYGFQEQLLGGSGGGAGGSGGGVAGS